MATTNSTTSDTPAASTHKAPVRLPRVTIEFCTACKWNLRAAYYAQELLQTFSASLGEVSLLPGPSGTFKIHLYTAAASAESSEGTKTGVSDDVTVKETQIWDKKVDVGFPETKELKNRVRNVIDPGRDLGHMDRALKKAAMAVAEGQGRGEAKTTAGVDQQPATKGEDAAEVDDCIDCKP